MCRKLCPQAVVRVLLLLLGWSAAVAGCAPQGPPLEPVAGVVTLNGQPLGGAIVMLVPQGGTLGQGGRAITTAEGKFELLQMAEVSRPGVLAGSYRVVISKLVNPDGSDYVSQPNEAPMDSPARETLPPSYSSYEAGKLSAEVPAGGTQSLKFELVGPAK